DKTKLQNHAPSRTVDSVAIGNAVHCPAKLQNHAPSRTVDSVADGFVAFDSAKALIDRAVAAVCRAKVGRCVYDFARYQTIRPLSASASIPRCRYSVDFTRIHRQFCNDPLLA